MKTVSNDQMVAYITENDKYNNIYAIYDLKEAKYTPLKVISCKVDEECPQNYLIQSQTPDGQLHYRINYTEAKYINAIVAELCQSSHESITIVSNRKDFFCDKAFLGEFVKNNGIRESKLLKWENKDEIGLPENMSFRLLSSGDEELVERFTNEDKDNLVEYFYDCCVRHPEFEYGELFGLINANQLVGYIACGCLFDNIYDVKHIYVAEQHRGNSYGKLLANQYGIYQSNEKNIPFYSNPQNKQSEMTATNGGFVYYSSEYVLNVSKRGRINKRKKIKQ